MNLGEQMAVTEVLNRVPFVRWDRLTDDGAEIVVYGWIDREDEHADFVVVIFDIGTYGPDREIAFGFTTSSHEHTERIGRLIFGLPEDSALTGWHHECKRVEHVLPGVESSVKLAA